jgi:hypothetical protein
MSGVLPRDARTADGVSRAAAPADRDRLRTPVTYEGRTARIDPAATRRFGRYWRVVDPFVGYVLGRVLARLGAAAGTVDERESGDETR